MDIHHNLLSRSGQRADVQKIISHPQALAQCRAWLVRSFPSIPVGRSGEHGACGDESGGRRFVGGDFQRHGQGSLRSQIIAANIEDLSNNITRFLVIGKIATTPSSDDKTSLVFSVQDKPGVLHRMLQPFARSRNINLTKIESRPIKNKPWEYLFFLDLRGHREQPAVKKAITGFEKKLCVFENPGILSERQMKIVEQVPEYIRSLIPYEPGKPIEEVEREYGIANSIKLASNENPLGPSPKALAAIRERLAQLNLYPDGDCFYLKRGLAQKLGVAPETLIFGNGSNEIIELAAQDIHAAGRRSGDGASRRSSFIN